MNKLVLATRNRGKIKEMKSLLAGLPFILLTPYDFAEFPEVEEDQQTFAGNAIQKAAAAARDCGEIAVADDSGLEVDALGGLPGVYSARFAGPDADDMANNRLLLHMLAGRSPEERKAVFRCAVAISIPGRKTYLVRGSCSGWIAEKPRGNKGFGYDPLFIYEPAGLTMAELEPPAKNLVSHRGRALRRAYRLIKCLVR